MHASRLVTEKPLKEPQTKVLVTKERDNTQGPDLGINCARVFQEVLPQLNNGGVINHIDLLSPSKDHNLHLEKKSKGVLVIARQEFGISRLTAESACSGSARCATREKTGENGDDQAIA